MVGMQEINTRYYEITQTYLFVFIYIQVSTVHNNFSVIYNNIEKLKNRLDMALKIFCTLIKMLFILYHKKYKIADKTQYSQ